MRLYNRNFKIQNWSSNLQLQKSGFSLIINRMPCSNFECRNSGIKIHLTMKNFLNTIGCRGFLPVLYCLIILSICGISCSKNDDPIIVPPDNSGTDGYENFLFWAAHPFDNRPYFHILPIGTTLGSETDNGSEIFDWDRYAGVEAAKRQFLFLHNQTNGGFDTGDKDFQIWEMMPNGEAGGKTDSGTWTSNYETLFGFHVGTRGFIFGQDSYGGHYWFVQEVTSDGKLAGAESDNGEWSNYYPAATPLYIGDQTFLFFQTSKSDNYWFITNVSKDGTLADSDDGYWGDIWPTVTSVTVGGNTYLIGHKELPHGANYFIQRINSNGTMGEETDRGYWNYYYNSLVGFSSGGHSYIYGCSGSNDGMWFIQEITADGKLGAETAHGILKDKLSGLTDDGDFQFFLPFKLYEKPGSFRYTIGWDLAETNGSPTRPWSSLFTDAWNGHTKSGGGAALAQIDGDASGRYDAVFAGIQDLAGTDRFYYKVAWNLDNSGKASAWSKTIFGPDCGGTQAGGGADIADIDGNGKPDLLLMSVDDPDGANAFWYYIGWNLNSSGVAASWSSKVHVNGPGSLDSGGGAALGDIDKNGRPELVLMGIDNPEQDNAFWYIVGRNLDKTGKAATWSQKIAAPCDLGWATAGGGAALADINGNGKPDLVFTSLDSPTGANTYWCFIGWDININGTVAGWSSKFIGPSPGNITCGGGTAIADIDKNGKLDLLLMSVDNPYGKD